MCTQRLNVCSIQSHISYEQIHLNRSITFCGDMQSVVEPKIAFCDFSEVKAMLKEGMGFIYYQPGGNWGSLYYAIQDDNRIPTLQAASSAEITVISAPQTIYYESSKQNYAKADAERINTLSSDFVKLMWRQHASYQYARKFYGEGATNLEVPDIAWMIQPPISIVPHKYDVVILFRADKERQTNVDAKMLCTVLIKMNHSCSLITWISPIISPLIRSRGPREYWMSVRDQAFGVISLGLVVITDRLHGAVISYIAGRGVVYLDSISNKTVGVLKTAFGDNVKKCTEGVGVFRGNNNDGSDIAMKASKLVKFLKRSYH